MVSHAAGCIALAKTLANKELQDITPAGPCSIYGLSRSSDTSIWALDPHDKPQGLNGYTEHLSRIGSTTLPWNNFGDGSSKFYTGPRTSRFAPDNNKLQSATRKEKENVGIRVDRITSAILGSDHEKVDSSGTI